MPELPLNGACHKSQGDRVIQVNVNLERQKRQADELLKSEEGVAKRKKRCFDVEPVFGNIKTTTVSAGSCSVARKKSKSNGD